MTQANGSKERIYPALWVRQSLEVTWNVTGAVNEQQFLTWDRESRLASVTGGGGGCVDGRRGQRERHHPQVLLPFDKLRTGFNGQRIAMTQTGHLSKPLRYLHWGHLGSTVLETRLDGSVIRQERYYAFGGDRYRQDSVSVNEQFTGQKLDGSECPYPYPALVEGLPHPHIVIRRSGSSSPDSPLPNYPTSCELPVRLPIGCGKDAACFPLIELVRCRGNGAGSA